jgi:hypothetical protein
LKILTGQDIKVGKKVFHVCLQWQPRDFWIGIFFDTWQPFAAYIIVIPCFPVHIKAVSL